LGCLAGLDEPDGGVVHVEGERLSRRPEEVRAQIRARRIGILYQQSNLVGHLSVEANVRLAQRLAGDTTSSSWRAELLDRCGIAARAHGRASQLSGGELARAGLAVALANDPAVLLADEPTGELDEVTAERILGLLRERASDGAAVLLVTHSPDVASAADREIKLVDGRIFDARKEVVA
jgi:putative ABC transport system ATP-binding protein